ncbi:MAG: quinone-dependent dihydroorotate dehydrogenase [Anaerolineales bacterium]|nr:quinone-dependent dihydroorotate dehydrogenase [Anaerolineales bacterium]
MYSNVIFPILKRMDAETVHKLTVCALAYAQSTPSGRALLRLLAGPLPTQPIKLFGLSFPNVIGMAAGFDKDVHVATGLALLGFGHVEVGTLTPRPQVGNPRPRIFRLPADDALINRMGFPNGGVETAVSHLRHLENRNFVLGVSLGKQKETPLVNAADDYIAVMRQVYPYADYLVVNISSPNTPGLRDLQGGRYLEHLLTTLMAENVRLAGGNPVWKRPLLVKIAPDLTWAELDDILMAVQHAQIDGIIATNTTTSRTGLVDANQMEGGGLSGRPLTAHSTEIIAYIHQQTGGKLPIIGVGGIFTADDVQVKLDAGASLVQLYTGLIYRGPMLIGYLLRDLAALI